MKKHPIDEAATADLSQVKTVQQLADSEGMAADHFAIRLAEVLRAPGNSSLTNQRARLQALAQAGSGADLAAADSLSQHALILEALFTRFAWESGRWLASPDKRAADYSEKYLNAAVKAQAAAARCLSALHVLRNAPSSSPTPAPAENSNAIGS